jgi:photosystem II stability/assembly factor-like uncharacterized protein
MFKQPLIPAIISCAFIASLCIIYYAPSIPEIDHTVYGEQDIKGLDEYMNRLLADPSTGKIPAGIRAAELDYAQSIAPAAYTNTQNAARLISNENWEFRGPANIGGRTRALAIDIQDENTILAGGVSSGMWKSTDQGKTWRKTFTNSQLPSVTCLAQDTRPGKTNRWYCGTGEYFGNSADLNGDGLLISNDNGNSWQPLRSTTTGTPNSFDGAFEFVHNIVTDPSNLQQDEVYVATGFGAIYRSTDGGNSFRAVLGGLGNQYSIFTDVAITKSGIVYAAMSQLASGGQTSVTQGIWRSVDGIKWTRITPADFPKQSYRMIIEINPLDENQVFFFGFTPNSGKRTVNFRGDIEWNSLWKYTYSSGDGSGNNGQWENRSDNLPSFGGEFGDIYTQQSYDLVLKIHPRDTNIMILGGTNLYRSDSAFRTVGGQRWIGGYKPGTRRPDFEVYDNQHPDQHAFQFFPSNPNKVLSGNDGGIQLCKNIMADAVQWISLNNDYRTTQFYTAALDHGTPGSNVIIGGLQDNGTLYTNSADASAPWIQPLSYDGAFCAIQDGGRYFYMSAQQGRIARFELDAQGRRIARGRIDPAGGKDYLFINPFTLDQANQNKMFVAGGKILWRNNDLSNMPMSGWDSVSVNWDSLPATRITNDAFISAVSSCKSPSGRVYYGTTDGKLYRMDSAWSSNPTPVDITGSRFPARSNIQCIAIDPRDGNKAMIVFSNYGVISLFYTTDAGKSWTPVAGNLEENASGAGRGPSCRWAQILPVGDGTLFLTGTSTGLYTTSVLDSAFTCWEQQGINTIGNSVVTMIDARISDGRVIVATHGSGMYSGSITQLPLALQIQPDLRAPANDTILRPGTVNYRWDTVPGAVFYRFELSDNPEFTSLRLIRPMISANTLSSSLSLSTGNTYYWRVFPINSAGRGKSSPIWKFTLQSSTDIQPEENSLQPTISLNDNTLHIYPLFRNIATQTVEYALYTLDGRQIWSRQVDSDLELIASVPALSKAPYIFTARLSTGAFKSMNIISLH